MKLKMVVRFTDSREILKTNETHLVYRNYLELPNSGDPGYFLKAQSFFHNYFSTHGDRNDKFKVVKKLNSRFFGKVGYKFNENYL